MNDHRRQQKSTEHMSATAVLLLQQNKINDNLNMKLQRNSKFVYQQIALINEKNAPIDPHKIPLITREQ